MTVYLDYNATAPMRPEVAAAMASLAGLPLNPSSVHSAGREAKKHLESARRSVAEALSVFPAEILFTASATEANTMALRGFPERALLVSAVEHPSVLVPAARLGASILPVDGQGRLRCDLLESQLAHLGRPALVSVQWANNETGVIQPLQEIAAIARRYDALLHVDAVQSVGRVALDLGLCGADLMTLCAHKAGGPMGVGALVARGRHVPQPLLLGGAQEHRLRAGTESVAAIVGFAALLSLPVPSTLPLREMLEKGLREACPNLVLHGEQAERLPNTVSVAMPGVSSDMQLMDMDLQGICVSAGSACASGKIGASHVLKAMGVADEVAGSTIRISMGWGSSEAEVEAFIRAWSSLYQRLRCGG